MSKDNRAKLLIMVVTYTHSLFLHNGLGMESVFYGFKTKNYENIYRKSSHCNIRPH